MKICFLMPTHWSAGLGGSEVQVKYIMAYLRNHTNHQLSMICRSSKASEEDGTPIHATTRFGRASWQHKVGADYLSVPGLLKSIAPDVVYTRRGTPLVGLAARYCRSHGKRLVFHIAHVNDITRPRKIAWRDPRSHLGRRFYEYGLYRADVIVAQAHYQSVLLAQQYGLSVTAVVPNVHPVPALPNKPAQPRVVLWVANLKPAKRPELYIELARNLESCRNTRFLMAGAIQDPRYARLLEDASSLSNFHYLGRQSLDEVNHLLESAHLFVNTSRQDGEGFPNTFIQAWLRQVPVVSLDVDADSILRHHGLGQHCEGSVSMLTQAVQTLLDDTERLHSMGNAARKFAVETFGDSNFARLTSLMEDCPTAPH